MLYADYTTVVQEWYSGMLIQHGADVIDAILPVAKASNGSGPTVSPYNRCSHDWTVKTGALSESFDHKKQRFANSENR